MYQKLVMSSKKLTVLLQMKTLAVALFASDERGVHLGLLLGHTNGRDESRS